MSSQERQPAEPAADEGGWAVSRTPFDLMVAERDRWCRAAEKAKGECEAANRHVSILQGNNRDLNARTERLVRSLNEKDEALREVQAERNTLRRDLTNERAVKDAHKAHHDGYHGECDTFGPGVPGRSRSRHQAPPPGPAGEGQKVCAQQAREGGRVSDPVMSVKGQPETWARVGDTIRVTRLKPYGREFDFVVESVDRSGFAVNRKDCDGGEFYGEYPGDYAVVARARATQVAPALLSVRKEV
jgi:hypothetical protein